METVCFFRGRKGDVVARLRSGKIAIPDRRGPQPREEEAWDVEVVKDLPQVAIVRLVAGPFYVALVTGRSSFASFALGRDPDVVIPEGIAPSGATCNYLVWRIPPQVAKRRIEEVERLVREVDQIFAGRGPGGPWYQWEFVGSGIVSGGLRAGLPPAEIIAFARRIAKRIREEGPEYYRAHPDVKRYHLPRSWVGDYPYPQIYED